MTWLTRRVGRRIDRPVDAQATPFTRNLYRRLWQYRGDYALVGQQQHNTGAVDQNAVIAAHNGGKYAAIQGWDSSEAADNFGGQVAVASDAVSKMTTAWNTYGIVPAISQHWTPSVSTNISPGNPVIGDSVNVANCFVPATTEYIRYTNWKTRCADDLAALSAAGVPVLWRPWHEAGYFWWSEDGAALYVQLWQDTYDYIVNTRGVHNALWVWTASTTGIDTAFYPGDAYVDVLGHDRYGVTDGNYNFAYTDLSRYTEALSTKLTAMTEMQHVPPTPLSAPFSWYLVWQEPYNTPDNTDLALTNFYADETVVNRDRQNEFLAGTLPVSS